VSFHIRDIRFHGENSAGIFFRTHSSLIPRLWFLPKRAMVVPDRGLPMPLPDFARDFQVTEVSPLSFPRPLVTRTPVGESEGNFIATAWERLWSTDDEAAATTVPATVTPAISGRAEMRSLEGVRMAKDGGWGSAEDERRFVEWLKQPK
jgi:hypothetical protein